MRGDIYRFPSTKSKVAHAQRGARYAVVVQSNGLALSTVLVAPTSTSVRPTSFRPRINMDGTTTYILTEQIAVADLEKLGTFAGKLDAHELAALDQALRITFDLL